MTSQCDLFHSHPDGFLLDFEQMWKELQSLLDSDVIEEAQVPTTWISPVVVVPKAKGEVRLCVDMR